MGKIHFEHYGMRVPSCGTDNIIWDPTVTKVLADVTCESCKKTWSFRDAKELLDGKAQ